jgi:hypothetical protein
MIRQNRRWNESKRMGISDTASVRITMFGPPHLALQLAAPGHQLRVGRVAQLQRPVRSVAWRVSWGKDYW